MVYRGQWNDQPSPRFKAAFLQNATAYAGATGQIDLIRLCIEDKSHIFVKGRERGEVRWESGQIWPGYFLVCFLFLTSCSSCGHQRARVTVAPNYFMGFAGASALRVPVSCSGCTHPKVFAMKQLRSDHWRPPWLWMATRTEREPNKK